MRLPGVVENFLYKTNKVLGLEINFVNENDFSINCCICEKSGSKISVPFTKSNLISVEQLKEVLPQKNLPVSIVFNGKGLMHKKISLSPQETVSTAFHKVIPTGNENNFYTQLYYGLEGQGFGSIIRRKQVDDIIILFEENGFKVIDFFLGPFVVENSLALTPAQSSVYELDWAQHTVTIEDKKIKDYVSNPDKNTQQDFQFGGFSVQSNTLLAFCAAFHYFIPLASIIHNNIPVLDQYKEYKNGKAFTKLLRLSLVFILAVCLINFIVFSQYFDNQKHLDAELTVYQNSISLHEKLSKELESKKAFLEKSGLAFSTKSSYFTDRLVYDLPEEIQLTYLSLFPIKNRIEKDSVLQFDNKKILIRGFCQKSILLNNWINLIKTKDFVQGTVLDNYVQDSDMKNGRFDITVILK